MKVELTRGVFIGHDPKKAGDVLDVSDAFGRELLAMGKAQLVSGEASARGAMTTESVPALDTAPKKGKGAA